METPVTLPRQPISAKSCGVCGTMSSSCGVSASSSHGSLACCRLCVSLRVSCLALTFGYLLFWLSFAHNPNRPKKSTTTIQTTSFCYKQTQTISMFSKTLVLCLASLAAFVSADMHFDRAGGHIGSTADEQEDRNFLRRMQSDRSCDRELDAINNCITVSSCATCLNNAYDSIFENSDTVTCLSFETNMCRAIQDNCPTCSNCERQAEDFYECLALRGGCSSFDCPAPAPPATPRPPTPTPPASSPAPPPPSGSGNCGMPEFTQYCAATHGGNAKAACIISA